MPHLNKFFMSATAMRSLIALAAVLLSAWVQWYPAPTESVFANEWLRDRFVRWQAAVVLEPRIVVIDIDESSLATVGPWPWPRSRLAELMENLLGIYRAKGVALDMVLPEPADRDGDTRLAMLSQHGPVVLAQAFDYVARPVPLRVGQLAGGSPASGASGIIPGTGFVANHPGLARARLAGNIGFVPDQDGAIRRLPLRTSFEGREYTTLSLALFECCAAAIRTKPTGEGLWRVPFQRDWSAYTVIRAADILNLRLPETAIAGRLVLVGSSSLGLADRVATPLTPSTSGVMVHAALLSALLDEQAGRAPAAWPGRWIAVIFTILAVLVTVYAFPRFSALANVALLGGAALAWLALAYTISPHDADFSATGPLASLLFLLLAAVPFDWQISQGKSRRLLETLRHYVAPAVVDELLRSDLKDPLAPRQGSVTTLIADMEGYTGQVERLPMEDAAQLTRDFLDCLTRPVLEKRGTLDKYTGDGLVAFWGAPLPIEDHADLALEAAQEIVAAVRRFSQARQQAGKPPLRVRIGIESGIAMAGDFGTSFRSIYTAVGDSVNIASRLQELARDLPYDIVVGAETAALTKRHRCKPLGDVLLRGKEKPTALYALEPVA
jgi:adenylate cyclase